MKQKVDAIVLQKSCDYVIEKGAGPGVVPVELSRDPYTNDAAPAPLSVSGGHARRAAGPYEWPDDETAYYYHVDHHTRKQELT